MSTTAKLLGELTHRHYAHALSVFLIKQSHGARLLRLLQTHNIGGYFQRLLNLMVYHIFHLPQFLRGHGLEMSKVKAKSVRSYQRSFLLHMAAQHHLQRFLQQMGRAVVFLCVLSAFSIHRQGNNIPDFKHSGNHMTYMTHFSASQLNSIFHRKLAGSAGDRPFISLLTAHGCIERCSFYYNRTLFAVRKCLCQFCLRSEYCNFRFLAKKRISVKLCGNIVSDLVVNRSIRTHVIRHRPGVSCLGTLLLHTCAETIFINFISLFFKDFLCQIQREAIGVIQGKRILPGQDLFSGFLKVRLHARQNRQSLIDGFIKFFLFLRQNFEDKVFLFLQLRISVLRSLDHRSAQAGKKCPVNSQQSSVSRRTADQTAQYIPAALIGGHDTI